MAICNPISLYNCHVQGNLYPVCGYCLHRRLGWIQQSTPVVHFGCHSAIPISSITFSVTSHPLLALSYSDTSIDEIVMLTFIGCVVGTSIITVLLSYSYITTTILRMNSTEGETQSFLCVCLPLTRCGCISWHAHVHVFQTQLQLLHGHRQNGLCLLHSCHPHVKGAPQKAISTELCSGWYTTFILKYLKILREGVQELWHRFPCSLTSTDSEYFPLLTLSRKSV